MDLDAIDTETIIARGKYSTVRAAHEDAIKALQVACAALTSTGSRLLKKAQPDGDEVPESPAELIDEGRQALDRAAALFATVAELAEQKRSLRPAAWKGK